MKTEKVGLDEFIFDCIASLERFEKHWRELSAKDKRNFPESLAIGDWNEQFVFYIESEKTTQNTSR